jgi:phosphatidylglycerophosphatase A
LPSLTLKRGRPDGPPSAWVILAAWGPCGWSPWAPGTVGTLGAIPLFWALRQLPLAGYLTGTLVLFLLAVPAATRAGRYWKVADASPIVIDEVVGYLVAMAFFPWSWGTALAGFLLFRAFDVMKPWPCSALDRMKTGLGVVLDDVAAGVYAGLALAFVQLGLSLLLGCSGGLHWWCMQLTP